MSALKIIKKESINAMKQVDHIIGEREILRFLTLLQGNFKKPAMIRDSSANQLRNQHGLPLNKLQSNKQCPFIINIFSSFQDEEHLYLELEYVEGCTLLSQINKMNKDISDNVTFYASEALQTIEFLHSYSIIYRDLKPENIVLSMTERGHMKLVDFGFARQLKFNGQKSRTNCGTPQYVAPEIIRGAGHSYEVDIWSFGVLIAEIISGQTPFQAENTKTTYEKISLCQPTYNRQISQSQRDLLNKIFVSEPDLRITLQEIKKHNVFKDIDWDRPMMEQFESTMAPYVPESAMFNEFALRNSDEQNGPGLSPAKPKTLAAAFLKSSAGGVAVQAPQRRLSFNHEHFEKFLKQDKKQKQNNQRGTGLAHGELSPKRKRQNPLGDFKFKKINEVF